MKPDRNPHNSDTCPLCVIFEWFTNALQLLYFLREIESGLLRSLFIMRRRYYGRRKSYNRDKYSIEHTNIVVPAFGGQGLNGWTAYEATDTDLASYQYNINVVPPTDIQGMRKIKHLTISFTVVGETITPGIEYALVYVPEGYEPQKLRIPNFANSINGVSAYSANQYIMSMGILDFNAGPQRISSHLSRNLNSGDRIMLLFSTVSDAGSTLLAEVTYAVTLQ